MEIILLAAALLMAFSNGANDNFKGFATVWGSDTLNYRQALLLATVTTAAGSLASLLLAQGLVQSFSGKGLVPDAVVSAPAFMLAVASGAAGTVLLATRLGLPVSTTHALIGGLTGAGLGLHGAVQWQSLGPSLLVPLLVSPLLAALLSLLVYRLLRRRSATRDCACVVLPQPNYAAGSETAPLALRIDLPELVLDSAQACATLDAPLKLSVPRALDRLHVLSAASICFARGVNDTPKLAALLLAAHWLDTRQCVVAIAVIMAAGGLLFSTRVARTMSKRVTRLNHTEGVAANLITALLVLFASKFGLPVSTTHVSVGAIAGVGASAGTLDYQALRNVLLSWLATLPLSALLAFAVTQLI